MRHVRCVIVSIVLCGCSTTSFYVPHSRLDKPETKGAGGQFGLGLSSARGTEVIISPDASYRPPTIYYNPEVKLYSNSMLGGGLSYSLNKFIDLSLKKNATPWVLSAKGQLLGQGTDSAKAGNFSLALSTGFGSGSQTKSGDQNGIFGPGGYNWSSSVVVNATDYAAIIGIRPYDQVLIYGGPYATYYTYTGVIEHKLSDNGLSPATSYSFASHGFNRGGNLAMQFFFGTSFSFAIEAIYSHFEIGGSPAQIGTYAGIALNWNQ